MALRQLRYSDKSGEEIPPRTGARIRVMYYDASKPDRRADLTDEEVEALLDFTVPVDTRPERRGGAYSRFEES